MGVGFVKASRGKAFLNSGASDQVWSRDKVIALPNWPPLACLLVRFDHTASIIVNRITALYERLKLPTSSA
jgi:hypothetical protein